MRTLRLSAFILLGVLVLLPAVLLRPVRADIGPQVMCQQTGEFMEVVAKERDKGLKLIGALDRIQAMLAGGGVSLEYFPLSVAIIQEVYRSPKKTPVQLRKEYETGCLKHYGIVEI